MAPVPILYFSDVLCVWAYIAQLRVDAVKAAYGDQVILNPRFCSVFGDTSKKFAAGWADRGGFKGYADHVQQAAEAFPEISVNPAAWRDVRPTSSMSPHLFLKAVQLVEAAGAEAPGTFERVTWALRQAFFRDARDIGLAEVQRGIAHAVGIRADNVEALLSDGRAHAALASDYQDASAMGIQGSPTFVLNEGRQKLYGNVGFRVIDANIQELLREPSPDHASWC